MQPHRNKTITKILGALIVLMSISFHAIAATTYPAGTNVPNTFFRANTFLSNTVFESSIQVSTGATAFKLSSDPIRIPGNPVATFRPEQTNMNLVVDFMPNGQPASNNQASWLDLLDRDIYASNSNLWRVVRMGIYTNGDAVMGTMGWGGNTSSTPQLLQLVGGTAIHFDLTTNDQASAESGFWLTPSTLWHFRQLYFSPDNTLDVGSVSFRPKTIYAGTSAIIGTNTIGNGSMTINGVTLPGGGKVQGGSAWIGDVGGYNWFFNHVNFSADDTYDLGQSSTRPKTVYVGTGGINSAGVIKGNASALTNASTTLFPATNSPSAGDTIRWNGTNFYWAP